MNTQNNKIVKFYDKLPKHIIPIQKTVPPYMPFEEGYGYQGVLLLDTNLDKIQCHICGEWHNSLGGHLRKHKITAKQYKDKIGLFRQEPLMSLKSINNYREANKSPKRKANFRKILKAHRLKKRTKRKHMYYHQCNKIQLKNRFGTCDAQLKFRLDEAIKKYGRVPLCKEETALSNCLIRRHGSWNKALEKLGYKPTHHSTKTKFNWIQVIKLNIKKTCNFN